MAIPRINKKIPESGDVFQLFVEAHNSTKKNLYHQTKHPWDILPLLQRPEPAPARPFTVNGDGMGVKDCSNDTGVRCGVDGPPANQWGTQPRGEGKCAIYGILHSHKTNIAG